MFDDPNTGTAPADTAKKCFLDNFRRYGNSQTNPEKFNLYKGLANLAVAVENLENRIAAIENMLIHVVSRLQ